MKILQYGEVKQMSSKALERRITDLCSILDTKYDEDDGHSGSPGEWIYEELDSIDQELKRRHNFT